MDIFSLLGRPCHRCFIHKIFCVVPTNDIIIQMLINQTVRFCHEICWLTSTSFHYAQHKSRIFPAKTIFILLI